MRNAVAEAAKKAVRRIAGAEAKHYRNRSPYQAICSKHRPLRCFRDWFFYAVFATGSPACRSGWLAIINRLCTANAAPVITRSRSTGITSASGP